MMGENVVRNFNQSKKKRQGMFLIPCFFFLLCKHVVKHYTKWYNRIKSILKKTLSYNSLTSYLKDRQFEKIKSWEITKSYRITFIWYLWNSEHKAGEIIADVEEWEKDLLECAKIYKKEQRDVIRKILNEVI